MGSSGSKESKPKPCLHAPIPVDAVPYAGPQIVYQLVQTNVKLTAHSKFMSLFSLKFSSQISLLFTLQNYI